MADKKATDGNAQPDATAVDVPNDEKTVYYNTSQGVHPRQHQPAVPEEADRVNKEAADRATPNADVDPSSPSAVPDPKEVKTTAGKVNEEISDTNAKGK